MNQITVKNFKGDEFSGSWNGKIYSSKVNVEGLVRIYVNDSPIHITNEELNRITSDVERLEADMLARNSESDMISCMTKLKTMHELHKIKLLRTIAESLFSSKDYWIIEDLIDDKLSRNGRDK